MIGQCHALAYIVQLQCTLPTRLVPLIYKAPNTYTTYNVYTTQIYSEISPFHVPSVRPSVSMQCCHLGPPRSFLLRYCNSFCLL
jgi:hypothetical protein